MNIDQEEAAMKFQCPATWLIAGPTSSGKSTLVKEMFLKADELFESPPHQILYAYSVWQPIFQELQDRIKNIISVQGLPSEMDFSVNNGLHSICIIDDLMSDAADSKLVQDLFCVKSHHLNWSVMFLVQNVFQKGKVMRSVSLNSHGVEW